METSQDQRTHLSSMRRRFASEASSLPRPLSAETAEDSLVRLGDAVTGSIGGAFKSASNSDMETGTTNGGNNDRLLAGSGDGSGGDGTG